MFYVVWKYPLKIGQEVVELPFASEILSFKIQNEVPTIWVLIRDANVIKENRRFLVTGTGFEFSKHDYKFIGTDFSEGSYVWHCFEILPQHPYT